MAIVRYHGLGASNLGKVRPAPYKYADPTDINNATSFPIYVKPGATFGDLFFGDGAPEFGMSEKQLRTWHNQKERRDAANTKAGFYTRCLDGNGGSAGMPFDPSVVDKLPLITAPISGDATKDNPPVLGRYTLSSARYADKQQIWCKKPSWMFETLTFKGSEVPEGWFDFRFSPEVVERPTPIFIKPTSQAASRLRSLVPGISNREIQNPEFRFQKINGLRDKLGNDKTNSLLEKFGVMPNYDFEYAEFAKFILPTLFFDGFATLRHR